VQEGSLFSKISSKRKVYSNTSLPQETRKISNNLNVHLGQLEKEQTKPKVCRRKEIINIRAEIETKKITEKSNETKSSFFEKINKADKPLARLINKKGGGGFQINRIRNKREVTTDLTEIQRS